MVWMRFGFGLPGLPGPLRDEMVRRLSAMDPKRKKPAEALERATAIAADPKAIGKAFEGLSEVGRTIVGSLTKPMVRMELAARVLARHGATELDDESDHALAKHFGHILEEWPIVSDNGFAFRANLQLVEPLAATVAEIAEPTFAVPRRAGKQGEGREVVSPLALALVPGLLLQRGRLTASRDLHGAVAKRLVAILPRIEAHARVWTSRRAIDRDESGTPTFDLGRAKQVIDSMSGMGLVERLAGDYVDESERRMIAVAAMADEGDTLDFLALVDATATPAMRLEASFQLLDVDHTHNSARLPIAIRRLLRGETGGNAQRSFVQPDFEVVLSDAVSLADAMIIGCAAELEHFGTVARLRLTKLALQKARVNGITKEMVVEALERASAKALPGNVATALAEWTGSVGTGTLRESIVLALDGDAGQLDRAARVLEGLTMRRPEAGLFLLSAIPKSKHLEQLRAIGLHVTNEIEASRVRVLAASASYGSEEDASAHYEGTKPVAIETRADVRFVDEGFRDVDARKVLDRKRVERLLSRSIPAQRPYEVMIAEETPSSVYGDIEDEDEEEDEHEDPQKLVNDAFDACRERFAHRRDWVVELEAIEDLDATRSLQVGAPDLLRELLRTAATPAVLRLVIVNAAERMLAARSK